MKKRNKLYHKRKAARKMINGYVPKFKAVKISYGHWEVDLTEYESNKLKKT